MKRWHDVVCYLIETVCAVSLCFIRLRAGLLNAVGLAGLEKQLDRKEEKKRREKGIGMAKGNTR